MANRSQRRRAARAISRSRTAGGPDGRPQKVAAIPEPPSPHWWYWWDIRRRKWKQHDVKVIKYTTVLATCPDQDLLAEIWALIEQAAETTADHLGAKQPDT